MKLKLKDEGGKVEAFIGFTSLIICAIFLVAILYTLF